MGKVFFRFNPAFLTKDELVRTFAARNAELRLICDVIRENTGQSNQHILVVGPRGTGKTMLTLRVVEEVLRTPEMNARWYPIVFPEESYQVTSIGEFWLEALIHLGQQRKDSRFEQMTQELGDEFARTHDGERLRERCWPCLWTLQTVRIR